MCLHRLVISSVVASKVVPAPVKGPGCSHGIAAWKAGRRGSFAGCAGSGLQVDLRWDSLGETMVKTYRKKTSPILQETNSIKKLSRCIARLVVDCLRAAKAVSECQPWGSCGLSEPACGGALSHLRYSRPGPLSILAQRSMHQLPRASCGLSFSVAEAPLASLELSGYRSNLAHYDSTEQQRSGINHLDTSVNQHWLLLSH